MITARVCDIILMNDHERYTGPDSLGTILWDYIGDMVPIYNKCTNCSSAKPAYKGGRYPLPGEIVKLELFPSKYYNDTFVGEKGQEIWYYYPPVAVNSVPDYNGVPTRINPDTGTYYIGKIFEEKDNIRPLLPYEGDVLFEGRFGNSIRFGSTIPNNPWGLKGDKGDPITIIRNGQKYINTSLDDHGNPVLEHIHKDDSSIYLCSGQQLTQFEPASSHDLSYEKLEPNQSDNSNLKEETELPNNDLSADVEEEIELTTVNDLPAQELQETNPLEGVNPDIDDYDIALTETTTGGHWDDPIIVPSNLQIPSGSVDKMNEPVIT